jgi:hypothetical protein
LLLVAVAVLVVFLVVWVERVDQVLALGVLVAMLVGLETLLIALHRKEIMVDHLQQAHPLMVAAVVVASEEQDLTDLVLLAGRAAQEHQMPLLALVQTQLMLAAVVVELEVQVEQAVQGVLEVEAQVEIALLLLPLEQMETQILEVVAVVQVQPQETRVLM